MTRKGQAELALGAGLVFSVIGGLFGTAVLILAAPALAEVALKFSSFEYFWLVLLGLTCAVFIATGDAAQGHGLAAARPAGRHRRPRQPGGLSALHLRQRRADGRPRADPDHDRHVRGVRGHALRDHGRSAARDGADGRSATSSAGMWTLPKKYPLQMLRGSVLGTLIGALPGAGADIAAWMSYAMSKRFSKEPEKFGTGHVEGIVESGAANNSALAGAWIPALVFGIPGDSITAIVIGVLYMKNMNPGPTLFIDNPQNIYAVFLLFILANLLMLPLGWRDQGCQAASCACRASVLMPLHPAVLHRRRLRHQQLGVRRRHDAGLRRARLVHGGERLSGRARDPRHGAGHDAGGELRHLDDQGGRPHLLAFFDAADRRHARRADDRPHRRAAAAAPVQSRPRPHMVLDG